MNISENAIKQNTSNDVVPQILTTLPLNGYQILDQFNNMNPINLIALDSLTSDSINLVRVQTIARYQELILKLRNLKAEVQERSYEFISAAPTIIQSKAISKRIVSFIKLIDTYIAKILSENDEFIVQITNLNDLVSRWNIAKSEVNETVREEYENVNISDSFNVSGNIKIKKFDNLKRKVESAVNKINMIIQLLETKYHNLLATNVLFFDNLKPLDFNLSIFETSKNSVELQSLIKEINTKATISNLEALQKFKPISLYKQSDNDQAQATPMDTTPIDRNTNENDDNTQNVSSNGNRSTNENIIDNNIEGFEFITPEFEDEPMYQQLRSPDIVEFPLVRESTVKELIVREPPTIRDPTFSDSPGKSKGTKRSLPDTPYERETRKMKMRAPEPPKQVNVPLSPTETIYDEVACGGNGVEGISCEWRDIEEDYLLDNTLERFDELSSILSQVIKRQVPQKDDKIPITLRVDLLDRVNTITNILNTMYLESEYIDRMDEILGKYDIPEDVISRREY